MTLQLLGTWRHLTILLKYMLSGAIATGIDVGLLYWLRSIGLPDVTAVTLGASIAIFVHYNICRYVVFKGHNRRYVTGLIYFVSIIGVSTILNIFLYLVLIELLPFHFTIVRVLSLFLIGIMSFLLNIRYNFKSLVVK